MLRTPEFIYFDLGNVVLHFDHHRGARQMAALAGVPEERVWDLVFAGPLELAYEAGQLTSEQFYEVFCRETGSRPDFEALLHAAADIFELNVPVVPLIAHLHSAGYRLGILSNTNAAHWEFVSRGRYAVLSRFFSVFALSYEIQSMKPEPKIYAEAARLAQVAPERIFFTDDRPENVAGAREAGFDAVQFHNHRQLADEIRARGICWNY